MKTSNSGKRSTVTLFDATNRLRLREARTGTVLVDRTVEARSTKCPIVHLSFDEDRTGRSAPCRTTT